MAGKKPTKAGICPECNRLKPLDRNGNLRKHAPPKQDGPVTSWTTNCAGTGRKPK